MDVCFYSAVEDELLFDRVGFHRDDIAALKEGVLQNPSLLHCFLTTCLTKRCLSHSRWSLLIGQCARGWFREEKTGSRYPAAC